MFLFVHIPLQAVGETTLFFVLFCNNTSRSITLGVLYGYKMLLQIIALIFAFSIRKVKVAGMNDAKYIGAAVYVTSIVTAIIIVLDYTLDQYINVYACVFCTCVFVGTTAILGLVLIPPVSLVHVLQLQPFVPCALHGKARSFPTNPEETIFIILCTNL